jgi:hypothetical protein
MKTSSRKKNQRLILVGKPAVVKQPWRVIKPFDTDQFVLKTTAELKEVATRDSSMMHPQMVEELATWNPPKVKCPECGWKGNLVDCSRVYFPPDDIGWDCGNMERYCDHRLVPGVDYQPNNGP